jgi:hypothetical protein
MKCPECREESITLSRIQEAAVSRDLPHGRPWIDGWRGNTQRYECKCLRCGRVWRPRNQPEAAKLFDAE